MGEISLKKPLFLGRFGWSFQVSQWQRIYLPMQEVQETWVPFLGQEGPLEKKMATHSSVLAWTVPWTEEPGGLQSMGVTKESDMTEQISTHTHTHMHIHAHTHTVDSCGYWQVMATAWPPVTSDIECCCNTCRAKATNNMEARKGEAANTSKQGFLESCLFQKVACFYQYV